MLEKTVLLSSESIDLMKRFEWVEHPSDVGFRAFGRDLAEAFANAGIALFEIMTDTGKVEPKEGVSIELRSESETSSSMTG